MKTSRKIQIITLVILGFTSGACTFYAKVGKGPRVIGEPQAPTSATPEVSK